MTIEEAIKSIKALKRFICEPEWKASLNMAIESLEKQIPKKTITIENNIIRNGCPVCECVNEDGNNYCRYCGQRLDWEGWRL